MPKFRKVGVKMTANTVNQPDYSDAAYSRGATVTHGHVGQCVRSGHIGGNDRCDRCGALQSWAYDEAHEATITDVSFGNGELVITGDVRRGSYGSDYFTLVVKYFGAVSGTVRGLSLPKMHFGDDDLEGWSPVSVHGALLVASFALGCPVAIGGSENNRRWLSERLNTEALTRSPEEASEAASGETSAVSGAEAVTPKPRLTFRGRNTGVAGQFSVDVIVTYPEEDSRLVSFVGNSAGGPVVMVTGEGAAGQSFVSDPNRFGSFADNPTVWVRRFFA